MIVRPKKKAAEDFIKAAPDAGVPAGEEKDRKKIQISLTISPELLKAVDEKARKSGLSRAALINLAIHQMISSGVNLPGL
ncbi:MAG: ribbon-helix-helix domain-containing protein [Leptospirillum sp.]